MNYFLVDFENVNANGIKDMSRLKEGDGLIIFYSDNCKNITIDVLDSIVNKKLVFNSFNVKVGTSNALDFQLSSYLGYLIGKNPDNTTKYYIVTNDKGYDCLCKYWKELEVSVERIGISKSTTTSKVSESNLTSEEEISNVLSKEDNPEEVLKIFNQYKSKQAINNGLAKLYKDSKKASEVYKKLRPLIKEKKKS